jgi:hypothetical protein
VALWLQQGWPQTTQRTFTARFDVAASTADSSVASSLCQTFSCRAALGTASSGFTACRWLETNTAISCSSAELLIAAPSDSSNSRAELAVHLCTVRSSPDPCSHRLATLCTDRALSSSKYASPRLLAASTEAISAVSRATNAPALPRLNQSLSSQTNASGASCSSSTGGNTSCARVCRWRRPVDNQARFR